MTAVTTSDPRTGDIGQTHLVESSDRDVAETVAAGVRASRHVGQATRSARARLLERIASDIDVRQAELVDAAEAETGLGRERLIKETARAAYQFRLFADVLRDGGYLEAAIDHAGEDPLGPAPDVRRLLVPIGPVAVFGASNFPFAFSALGGDTASALAAGCPVIVKAHPLHPLTTDLSVELLRRAAARELDAADAIGVVYGFDAGRRLITDPRVRAACLTGSLRAARAMQELISTRDEPIPLYGELGSVNPLVVLPGAAQERASDIAAGLYASFTGSVGQLCTKPGLAFVPDSESGARIVTDLRALVRQSEAAPMLSQDMRDSFVARVEAFAENGARVTAIGADAGPVGFRATPRLLESHVSGMDAALAEECFGPVMIVMRYSATDELTEALRFLPPALTCTIHQGVADDVADVRSVLEVAEELSGRIVFNGYPTGVRVSWAQHHGGPWPATNSVHTSVGATGIRRFLRPRAYQDTPQEMLPRELRDDYEEIPRRIDGVLVVPATV